MTDDMSISSRMVVTSHSCNVSLSQTNKSNRFVSLKAVLYNCCPQGTTMYLKNNEIQTVMWSKSEY